MGPVVTVSESPVACGRPHPRVQRVECCVSQETSGWPSGPRSAGCDLSPPPGCTPTPSPGGPTLAFGRDTFRPGQSQTGISETLRGSHWPQGLGRSHGVFRLVSLGQALPQATNAGGRLPQPRPCALGTRVPLGTCWSRGSPSSGLWGSSADRWGQHVTPAQHPRPSGSRARPSRVPAPRTPHPAPHTPHRVPASCPAALRARAGRRHRAGLRGEAWPWAGLCDREVPPSKRRGASEEAALSAPQTPSR